LSETLRVLYHLRSENKTAFRAAWRLEVGSWPEELRGEWDERAAIMELDGNLTRNEAEYLAFEDVERRIRKNERNDC